MSTLDELYLRKSTRDFLDKEIDDETLEILYDAAINAPSGGNQQPYAIINVKDKKKKEILAKTCDNQMWMTKAPLYLVFLVDQVRWYDLYKSYDLNPSDTTLANMWMAVADATIAAQNVVVAAESLGLGSCYIGDIIEQYEIVKETLNLPEGVMPACMLVIGYPTDTAKNRKKPNRFNKNYIIHDDEYHRFSNDEHHKYYEERFNLLNNQDKANYKQSLENILMRKRESDFSKEMNRSIHLYLKPFLKDKVD